MQTAAHWDGAVNDAAQGRAYPALLAGAYRKPESVRGTVRKLFANAPRVSCPACTLYSQAKEQDAQALIQQAEQLVSQAVLKCRLSGVRNFLIGGTMPMTLPATAVRLVASKAPAIGSPGASLYGRGLSKRKSRLLPRTLAGTLQQESESSTAGRGYGQSKNALTATAFRDLSAILGKAGSPAAGALVVPNGRRAPLSTHRSRRAPSGHSVRC